MGNAYGHPSRWAIPIVREFLTLTTNGKLYQENDYLRDENDRLTSDITYLTGRLKDYKLLHKIFGREHMDGMLEQVKQAQKNRRNKARLFDLNQEKRTSKSGPTL